MSMISRIQSSSTQLRNERLPWVHTGKSVGWEDFYKAECSWCFGLIRSRLTESWLEHSLKQFVYTRMSLKSELCRVWSLGPSCDTIIKVYLGLINYSVYHLYILCGEHLVAWLLWEAFKKKDKKVDKCQLRGGR